MSERSLLHVFGKLLLDILLATLLFLAIALPAVALNKAVIYLEADHISKVITQGLSLLEYLIFLLDAMLFIIYLVRTFIDTAKEIWNR